MHLDRYLRYLFPDINSTVMECWMTSDKRREENLSVQQQQQLLILHVSLPSYLKTRCFGFFQEPGWELAALVLGLPPTLPWTLPGSSGKQARPFSSLIAFLRAALNSSTRAWLSLNLRAKQYSTSAFASISLFGFICTT